MELGNKNKAMASKYVDNACPCCLKVVLDSDKGIQCEMDCLRWFHPSCVNMSDAVYNKYASNVKKTWQCDRVDCSTKGSPMQTMSDQIAKILTHMSKLPTRDEVAAISGGISEIKTDLKEIQKKLSDFEPRLKMTEDRLDVIEEKINSALPPIGSVATAGTAPEDIIAELNERRRRAQNVLVYNVPEKRSPDTKARISHDRTLMEKLIQGLSQDIDSKAVKVLRLGRQNKDKVRPVKLVFCNDNEARAFSEHFSKETVVALDEAFVDISISRDKTLQERQHLMKLRSELNTRTGNGEKNLTIKYRNGIPQVVSTQSKND